MDANTALTLRVCNDEHDFVCHSTRVLHGVHYNPPEGVSRELHERTVAVGLLHGSLHELDSLGIFHSPSRLTLWGREGEIMEVEVMEWEITEGEIMEVEIMEVIFITDVNMRLHHKNMQCPDDTILFFAELCY